MQTIRTTTDIVRSQGTFTNQVNQATPDLLTDALTGRTNGGGIAAPLLAIMRARRDGFLPQQFAAANLTQDQARAWLMSHGVVGGLIADSHAISAECFFTSRGDPGSLNWGVDASIAASGDPVLLVRSRQGGPFVAAGNTVTNRTILTIRCRHTVDL